MSAKWIRLALLLVASIVPGLPLWGCSAEKVAPGEPCENSSQCGEGLECICVEACEQRFCSRLCSGGFDCAPDFKEPVCKGFGIIFICLEKGSSAAQEGPYVLWER
jgi:hypothetical protein